MPTIGYYPGVWDLFHVGHLLALRKASLQVDRLVVGVPSDDIVMLDKNKAPIIPCSDRIQILAALACVYEVKVYHSLEFLTHLNLLNPDVLFVGEDWGSEARHRNAETWIHVNQRKIIMIPRYQFESTTLIKERIRNERS